jgi:kynurenine formamidase
MDSLYSFCSRIISRSLNMNRNPPTPPADNDRRRDQRPGQTSRPTFGQLPLQPHHPKGSAWGLWGGFSDELGTLNLLTPQVTLQAAQEIKSGLTIPLNLPLNSPLRPMNPARRKCFHHINAKGHANDDEIFVNTQSSSHWDGLRHYPYQDGKRYYNGTTQADITGPSANPRIGVQNMAQKGIAGRGVLLDWRSYALRKGIKYSPFEPHQILLRELIEVAAEEAVQFHSGDILLVRSGWTEEYNKLSEDEKDALGLREERKFCGVEASEEAIRWHWDNQISAVAGDTVAYEAWPSPRQWGVSMHEVFLSGWGMPIGETWDLEELSRVCSNEGRWTFFLTSQPLNLSAGIASPANVMAIL